MGWFDQDNKAKPKEDAPVAAVPQVAPATPKAPAPPAAKSAGSRLGERVHVNGTIVCEEDLTLFGKVEGTIHSGHLLLVSKEAELKAVIHGRRVMVEGTVAGDIHGSETVVLGPTAQLTGNIHTPSLQIREGAYFKGNVEMQVPVRDKAPAKPADKQTADKPAAGKATPAASVPKPDAPQNEAAGASSSETVTKPGSSSAVPSR